MVSAISIGNNFSGCTLFLITCNDVCVFCPASRVARSSVYPIEYDAVVSEQEPIPDEGTIQENPLLPQRNSPLASVVQRKEGPILAARRRSLTDDLNHANRIVLIDGSQSDPAHSTLRELGPDGARTTPGVAGGRHASPIWIQPAFAPSLAARRPSATASNTLARQKRPLHDGSRIPYVGEPGVMVVAGTGKKS